jgi:ACS family hexuronate transporter-like MFS transporter
MRWPERRWWICGMLFAAATIAYIDRQTFPFVASTVQKEYGLSNEQVARIFSAFLMSYTLGQPLAGHFFDRVGSRVGFAVSIGVWSLANMLTATVTRFRGFVGCRLALGLGESGNYPGGVKVVGEQFSSEERSFAGGIFTSGASVGAILAGPLVTNIAGHWGWRAAFIVTGGLGFLWLAGWWFLARTHSKAASSPWRESVSDDEFARPETGRMPWSELLRFRQVWAITIARFLEEPAFWVWIFWLPKYIEDKRGLSGSQTGWLLIQPYVALDVGYLSGGWISGRLMRRGWSARRSRRAVMIVAALLMMSSIPAVSASSVTAFTALISLALMGHGAWFTNAMTMPSDIAPRGLVASLYGITAMGGGLGGVIATEATGVVVDRFDSFVPVFVAAGVLPMVATAALVLLGGEMSPLESRRPTLDPYRDS